MQPSIEALRERRASLAAWNPSAAAARRNRDNNIRKLDRRIAELEANREETKA